MKRAFHALLLFIFVAGCTAVSPTTNLRLGMTKDEAIKIMGTPDSISAQSNIEYLNYSRTEYSGTYTSISRPYYIRLVDGKVESFGYSGQFTSLPTIVRPMPGRTEVAAANDGIKILSIDPPALTPGKENTVTLKLRYSLNSHDQGTIGIGFNNVSNAAFAIRHNETVVKGTNEVTVPIKVLAVDWGELNEFKVFVFLQSVPRITDRPLASDIKSIPLTK